MIEIKEELLNDLLREYGYELPKYEYGLLRYLPSNKDSHRIMMWDNLLIAKFVKFLRLCGNNEYKIVSTIKHPQKGRVEGSVESITFDDNHLYLHMRALAEQMLHYAGEGDYEYEFGWDEDRLDDEEEWGCVRIMFEPYSDEQLDKILEYEHTKAERKKGLKGNAFKGKRLYFVYRTFEKAGYFGESKQKEYSFLYDWCVLAGVANDIGEGYSGLIGKEKYQQIKNWFTAYEKYVNNYGKKKKN